MKQTFIYLNIRRFWGGVSKKLVKFKNLSVHFLYHFILYIWWSVNKMWLYDLCFNINFHLLFLSLRRCDNFSGYGQVPYFSVILWFSINQLKNHSNKTDIGVIITGFLFFSFQNQNRKKIYYCLVGVFILLVIIVFIIWASTWILKRETSGQKRNIATFLLQIMI